MVFFGIKNTFINAHADLFGHSHAQPKLPARSPRRYPCGELALLLGAAAAKELLRCFPVLLRAGITSPFSQISEALLLTGRPPPPLQLRGGGLGAFGGPSKGGVDVSFVFFDVRKADIYMLGVLLFYSWADGAVWATSDAQQDEQ